MAITGNVHYVLLSVTIWCLSVPKNYWFDDWNPVKIPKTGKTTTEPNTRRVSNTSPGTVVKLKGNVGEWCSPSTFRGERRTPSSDGCDRWTSSTGLLSVDRPLELVSFSTVQKQNMVVFSFRGLHPPDLLTRGYAPGPHWGLRPRVTPL